MDLVVSSPCETEPYNNTAKVMRQKNNKRCLFYVLYCDKAWGFDQSEHAQGPTFIINGDNIQYKTQQRFCKLLIKIQAMSKMFVHTKC